jgi:DNA topoisomerase VI subunit A
MTAATGGIKLIAATGIGSAGALRTTVDRVDIVNSQSGAVLITETDGLRITKINNDGVGSNAITVNTNGATRILEINNDGVACRTNACCSN